MTRNEILEVAGQFYKPETITEREIAFARHMMAYERGYCYAKAEVALLGTLQTTADRVLKAIKTRNQE